MSKNFYTRICRKVMVDLNNILLVKCKHKLYNNTENLLVGSHILMRTISWDVIVQCIYILNTKRNLHKFTYFFTALTPKSKPIGVKTMIFIHHYFTKKFSCFKSLKKVISFSWWNIEFHGSSLPCLFAIRQIVIKPVSEKQCFTYQNMSP